MSGRITRLGLGFRVQGRYRGARIKHVASVPPRDRVPPRSWATSGDGSRRIRPAARQPCPAKSRVNRELAKQARSDQISGHRPNVRGHRPLVDSHPRQASATWYAAARPACEQPGTKPFGSSRYVVMRFFYMASFRLRRQRYTGRYPGRTHHFIAAVTGSNLELSSEPFLELTALRRQHGGRRGDSPQLITHPG